MISCELTRSARENTAAMPKFTVRATATVAASAAEPVATTTTAADAARNRGDPSNAARNRGGPSKLCTLPAALLLLVLMPLAAAQRYTASDKLFITDAVQPPRVLAFDVRSKRMRTQVQYTVASLLGPEGLRDPLTADGRNRTLRPHGIVLREGDIADTIYWADAGASAILALRIDGSPARVVAGGALDDVVLDQPEQVAFVREPNGGLTLYWADLGFNKIARCALQETDEKPGRCGSPEDVVLATPMVTGLVADEATRMIYWTDGVDQYIRGAPMDSATPASRAAAAVDVRAWAPMPSCLTLIGEATDGDFEGEPPTLYWADQASPPSIRRRFLNGSDVEQVLFDSYLAKPAALVLSRRSYDSLIIADAGKHDLLLARREPLESGDGSTIVIYHDDALEPRGLAMRADTDPRTSDTLLEDAASPPASGVVCSAAAAVAVSLVVGRRRQRS